MPRPSRHDAHMPSRNPLREILGTNAKKLRTAKNISQAKLHQATKHSGAPIDSTTIGRIERADNPTSVDSLAALARGLGVEPWQLLVEDLNPKQLPALSTDGLAQDEKDLISKYRAASPRWRMALQHLSALRSDQQEEVSEGTMVLLAKAAAEPAKDERVVETFGTAPHAIHDSAKGRYKK